MWVLMVVEIGLGEVVGLGHQGLDVVGVVAGAAVGPGRAMGVGAAGEEPLVQPALSGQSQRSCAMITVSLISCC